VTASCSMVTWNAKSERSGARFSSLMRVSGTYSCMRPADGAKELSPEMRRQLTPLVREVAFERLAVGDSWWARKPFISQPVET